MWELQRGVVIQKIYEKNLRNCFSPTGLHWSLANLGLKKARLFVTKNKNLCTHLVLYHRADPVVCTSHRAWKSGPEFEAFNPIRYGEVVVWSGNYKITKLQETHVFQCDKKS